MKDQLEIKEAAKVDIWEEEVYIPTYGIGKPDKNPMFFEKRIYQGSSGAVYPNPVIEKIFDDKEDKAYRGLFLENQYIKIMVLPELGGRIQMAYDKIKERHFIYYNQVIKPALVGLTGPWISGGIEFNWPQHHRPSTFDPTDYKLETHDDGSKTIWVNEVEQMFHTKGMAGFTLYPDKAYIEIKAKLLNRSALPQTFLWWANPAVKVNDDYQSVFPPDVNAVFDHGKRDVSTFPIATGTYYKVDYSPGTDISMYKNIPVPTSYMAINSDYDFVGGYEHDSKGGLLHVANHHVSPGKKQWTWGHSDFGQAWDRNLTDEDGPYIELMTGMFTDNQPDFTWLMPNEEKSFVQYFMPYKELGLIKNASKDILIALDKEGNAAVLKIYVTGCQNDLVIRLTYKGSTLFEDQASIVPEVVYDRRIALAGDVDENLWVLTISNSEGKVLISYAPATNKINEIPAPAKPAVSPGDTENNEQLFLTAQHLEQYRHATYSPVPYYEEALKRDPKDIRCNNALGLWYLRRGKFTQSEKYFNKAIETSTQRNPNPYDTEPYYHLGLCLKFQDRIEEAYKAFYKSAWGKACKDNGYFAVAQIDMLRKDYALAIEHINSSMDYNRSNSKAYVLKAAALRKLNDFEPAIGIAREGLERDPFNLAALYELTCCYGARGHHEACEQMLNELLQISRQSAQNLITYALDYVEMGLLTEATDLLQHAVQPDSTQPMVYYHLACCSHLQGQPAQTSKWLSKAAQASSYLCFPNRLEDIKALEIALELNPDDAKAPYYLGNLYYDKRQYDDAIAYWERSAAIDGQFPTVLRNLGIAYFNKLNEPDKAIDLFERAFAIDNNDARVLMELDQLYKRLNRSPEQRLSFLNSQLQTLNKRDDLYLERIYLLNFLGYHPEALELIKARQFHPWEGGEGKASGQYVYSLLQLAITDIEAQNWDTAIELLHQAQFYPHNLGEGKLFGTQENDLFYWLACAYEGQGNKEKAREFFEKATVGLDEPAAAMFYNDQQPDKIFYQGLAWEKLGRPEKASNVFRNLLEYAKRHLEDDVKIDYFAVSLPNLIVFEDNLNLRNQVHCKFIEGLGLLGLGRREEAEMAFSRVLTLDTTHLGAKTHINMPILYKKV